MNRYIFINNSPLEPTCVHVEEVHVYATNEPDARIHLASLLNDEALGNFTLEMIERAR